MKTKLVFLSVFLVIGIMGFIYGSFKMPSPVDNTSTISTSPPPQSEQNSRWTEKYYIGAINSIADCKSGYVRIDSLGFNLWHNYMGIYFDNTLNRHAPYVNWIYNPIDTDKLLTPVSVYANSVNSKIDGICQNRPDRKLLMSRPKLDWLCYGQRSDYQCAPVNVNDDLWFYSFNEHGSGIAEPDNIYLNGKTVMHSRTLQNNPTKDDSGFVVKRLKANTEQSRRINDPSGGVVWTGDSQSDWIIKPRIRIDSNFANNLSNGNTLVCRIDIRNQDSVIIKSFEIKVRNFKPNQFTNYDGNYLEEYYFQPYNDTSSQIRNGDWGNKWVYAARGNMTVTEEYSNANNNHADIQVYWYGNCDMWIDYVRVDNDVADNLFKGFYDNTWIKDEVEQIGMHTPSGASSPAVMRYYLELAEFNNLSCIHYVDSLVKHYSDDKIRIMQIFYNFISAHVPWLDRTKIENPGFLKRQYIDKVGFSQIFAECYPFTACYGVMPENQKFSKIPNTLPIHDGIDNKILGKPVSPAVYDTWLQDQLFHRPNVLEGYEPGDEEKCGGDDPNHQHRGWFRYIMQTCNTISREANIPFIFMPQAHQNYEPGEVEREPTNEELNMTTNVAVSYGAKGILYFGYWSWGDGGSYVRGIADVDGYLRTLNVYRQDNPNKKETFRAITERVGNKWGPYLLSFDNTKTNSYIYDIDTARASLNNNTYFIDAATYKPGTETPSCTNDDPGGNQLSGLIYDCMVDRYLQVAVFNKTVDDGNQYFMIVNRRCSPYYNESSEDNRGGKRYVRIRLHENSPSFAGYNNWKIIDLYTDQIICTFDKRTLPILDLGWYLPGEGKLYKITPIIKTGGTLDCDENVSNLTFDCEGTVYNNGHNISIGANTTVNFSNNGKIVMEGGNFICGSSNAITNNVILRNKTGENWDGLELNDCDTIYMVYSTIQGLKSNNTVGLNISNCGNIFIANNSFSLSDLDVIPLEINLSSIPDTSLIGIYNNNFNVNYTTGAVVVLSTAALQVPVYIQNNTITSQNESSSIGILLNNVSLGVVTENTISNFRTGIHLQSSSADLYGNNVQAGTKGVNSTASSDANLSPTRSASGLYYTGGNNIIDAVNTDGNDLYAENSYFYTSKGKNTFNIISPGTFHFSGYFPDNCNTNNTYDADNNCFKVDNTDTIAISNTACGIGMSPVNFNFLDYYCQAFNYDQMEILSVSNFIRDTIRINTNGAGGESNVQLSMLNDKLRADENQTQTTYKSLRDSININMRKRNYNSVINQCTELLNNYSDSSFASDAISKLYVSSLKTDNNGNKIGPLKTYFETLILNQSNNLPLIKKANYFVQKCKVSLKQYASALQGFQEIINQNPYSYEGLVASWDYSATQLLSLGSGGFNNAEHSEVPMSIRIGIQLEEQENVEDDEIEKEDYSLFTSHNSLKEDFSLFASHISLNIEAMLDTLTKRKVNFISVTSSDYDKSKFTQKDRQQIQTNIESAFNDERSK